MPDDEFKSPTPDGSGRPVGARHHEALFGNALAYAKELAKLWPNWLSDKGLYRTAGSGSPTFYSVDTRNPPLVTSG